MDEQRLVGAYRTRGAGGTLLCSVGARSGAGPGGVRAAELPGRARLARGRSGETAVSPVCVGQVQLWAERRLGQEGARVRDRVGGGRREKEKRERKREKGRKKKGKGKRNGERKRKREREGEKGREIAGADRGERSRVATGRRAARDGTATRKKKR